MAAMSAIIRYVYPSVDPWSLDEQDFARIWREAQYCIDLFKLITKDESRL